MTGLGVAQTLAAYAREHQVMEIVIGHSHRSRWQEFVTGSVINDLIRLARGIDVLVTANSD